ncbi:AraC family transcriptional regulator [Embleya scabrispora]|uniref:AraC family transcriptional regulator n=1 Tax=Embleya scabrispora TaxID=159449 RepID=A0A1T3NT90_9ACTN|nr:helix-turn-helix domain-containing protein [Embleya scabrispora]OPC79841.1 AraC family transcriptional regulator [Embleya scabrispora]
MNDDRPPTPARPVKRGSGPGSVAVAVVDDAAIPTWDVYELAIACAVFGTPQPELTDTWYDFRVCAESPDPAPEASVTEAPGFSFGIRTPYGWDALAGADTVIVAAVPQECVDHDVDLPAPFLTALRAAADAGARMVSLCTGAFALAAAGILDGRRATAHWAHTEQLARRHPEVTVDDSVLYVDDGSVLTSAGMTAGLDLCLHIVRTDLGAHIANQLARRLVVQAHRPGGQAQFVDLSVPAGDDEGLAPVLHWAGRHLDRPLTVDDLARRARMSPRTFFRRLQAATGTTPLQWLLNQRLARAQSLLETTDLPIEQIGEHSGLGTAANLRHHFAARLGTSPADYRRAFRP